MSNKDFLSYKDLYIKVALENLHILKTNLPLLRQNSHDPTLFNNMHRAVHNLKTESLLMKYTQIALLCLELENMFLSIKTHQLSLSETFFSLIEDASTHMEQSIHNLEIKNKEINLLEFIRTVKERIKSI